MLPSGVFRYRSPRGVRRAALAFAAPVLAAALAWTPGIVPASATPTASHTSPRVITAIGTENEYANVIAQIGGRYVKVASILNNPNTDPHTFESSPSVAEEVSAAQLIVQNGVGYDAFMNKIESASPSSSRKVLTVQTLLGLPDDTPNPHLWYNPETMPTVALAIASALAGFDPSEATYFEANLKAFDNSLAPWVNAIVGFAAKYSGTAVATTEPVADYLLNAIGAYNLTPFGLQADIMNGVDPSPQDISLQEGLFSSHKVRVFVYNQQVVDSLTTSFRTAAEKAGIPVVGVYETMPTPGYNYQTWMLAEVESIEKAVADKVSTEHL
jgi:zinc/manganese transport system substrate-binding protein